MPLYDFRCEAHGTFEAISTRNETLRCVEPVRCPKCGVSAPMVWLRPPGVRNDDIRAVRFAGHVIDSEQFERQLEAELNRNPDDDSDAFWNKPDFEEKYYDVLDEKNTKAENFELPPCAPTDVHSVKVLTEALTKKG
jgi:putative FmdB family regulatory protein